jgi:hypothetical protein
MPYLHGLLALTIAAAGWYYMFYSRAASDLVEVEGTALNLRRVRLRRLGGFFMLLLGVGIFAGFFTVSWDRPNIGFLAVWLGVCFMVLAILVLGIVDLRLTWQLRQARMRRRQETGGDHEA